MSSSVNWAERDEWFNQGFHWCSKCERKLSLRNFWKSKNERYGYNKQCKQCASANRKGDKRNNNRARRYSRGLKAYYRQLLGGKCAKCGYGKTQMALDFHHVNPNDKEATVSRLITSNEHPRIMLEVDKCLLLCKNCHIEFDAYVWTAEFVKVAIGYEIDRSTIVESEKEYWEKVSDKILFEQQPLF